MIMNISQKSTTSRSWPK